MALCEACRTSGFSRGCPRCGDAARRAELRSYSTTTVAKKGHFASHGGLYVGLVLGAIAGGPVGAVIGAVIGAWIVDR